jgi:hypothetical protein
MTMDILWKTALKSQFIASIEMLGKAIQACPEELWHAKLWDDPNAPPGFSDFWYVAYHTLFWLDLYLSGAAEGFNPPPPFDLNELEPERVLPSRVFRKDELLAYLDHCRQECAGILDDFSDEKAHQDCEFPWSKGKISYAELLLDNMRHVQEHGSQLCMFLGQRITFNPGWVGRT